MSRTSRRHSYGQPIRGRTGHARFHPSSGPRQHFYANCGSPPALPAAAIRLTLTVSGSLLNAFAAVLLAVRRLASVCGKGGQGSRSAAQQITDVYAHTWQQAQPGLTFYLPGAKVFAHHNVNISQEERRIQHGI